MKKYFKQTQPHTDLRGAMESGDHSKNGANPKSLTSRGNSKSSMYMTGLIMSIFFVMVTMFPASANISVYAEVSGEMITMADIDPETVSIPRYDKISSEWLDDSGRDRYKKVEWYNDGISGYIYRDKDGDIYFKYGGGAAVYYRTEKDAIEALYVEKKYDKLRKTGRISK